MQLVSNYLMIGGGEGGEGDNYIIYQLEDDRVR
jgi:hypothetical protein